MQGGALRGRPPGPSRAVLPFVEVGSLRDANGRFRSCPRGAAPGYGSVMTEAERVGQVSVDGGAIAIVDAQYLMTDEDHDAGRDEGEVVQEYDAAYVPVRADGVFPVY